MRVKQHDDSIQILLQQAYNYKIVAEGVFYGVDRIERARGRLKRVNQRRRHYATTYNFPTTDLYYSPGKAVVNNSFEIHEFP